MSLPSSELPHRAADPLTACLHTQERTGCWQRQAEGPGEAEGGAGRARASLGAGAVPSGLPFTARLGAVEATLRVRTSPTIREGVPVWPAV